MCNPRKLELAQFLQFAKVISEPVQWFSHDTGILLLGVEHTVVLAGELFVVLSFLPIPRYSMLIEIKFSLSYSKSLKDSAVIKKKSLPSG